MYVNVILILSGIFYTMCREIYINSGHTMNETIYLIANVQFYFIVTIYLIYLLCLWNIKLYKFISFTTKQNQVLSQQINNKLMYAVTKLTSLMSMGIIMQFVLTTVNVAYAFNSQDIIWRYIYICSSFIYWMIYPILLYLSFNFADPLYAIYCKWLQFAWLRMWSKVPNALIINQNQDLNEKKQRSKEKAREK